MRNASPPLFYKIPSFRKEEKPSNPTETVHRARRTGISYESASRPLSSKTVHCEKDSKRFQHCTATPGAAQLLDPSPESNYGARPSWATGASKPKRSPFKQRWLEPCVSCGGRGDLTLQDHQRREKGRREAVSLKALKEPRYRSPYSLCGTSYCVDGNDRSRWGVRFGSPSQALSAGHRHSSRA
jgi:hypothetical protein